MLRLVSFGTLLSVLVFAQDKPEKWEAAQTAVAHGEAMVSVRPDQARVQLGVVTQGQTAAAAGAQNAQQTTDVIAALRKLLGADAEIRTTNYSLYPNYTNARDGRAPVIAGYNANNTVEIKLDDLAQIGKVIDGSTRMGANTFQGVQFSLKDEQKVRGEALKQAARQARRNAESLAGGLGLSVRRVLRIEDASEPAVVMPRMAMAAMARAEAAPTPIEPGMIEVRVIVKVVVELVQ